MQEKGTKMRVAILDDLEEAIADLKKKLPKDLTTVDSFTDVESFKIAQKTKQYDLIFLDIDLGNIKDGVDIAETLKKSQVVFVTAFTLKYVEKVMNGKVSAAGFLKKPVDEEQLEIVLQKVKKNLQKIDVTVSFAINGRTIVLPIERILYLEGDRHRTLIYMEDGTVYSYNAKLADVISMLPDYFLECHKSFLVNPKFVKEIDKKRILLNDGKEIPVSRSRADLCNERFMRYIGGDLC